MKKNQLIFSIMLLLSLFTLAACDATNEEENLNTEKTEQGLILSDYTLADNFMMTIQLNDSSIMNPGPDWYYKTAKIGNDWQVIEYDRDLADLSIQVTHFFKYLSDDLYMHYLYNHADSEWVKQGELSFHDMVFTSPNNFKFLYEKPTEIQIVVEETISTYDTDSTSNEQLIDIYSYQYTEGLDKTVFVDYDYPSTCLYEVQSRNGQVAISWKANDYTLDISNWDDFYLSYRHFQNAPSQ